MSHGRSEYLDKSQHFNSESMDSGRWVFGVLNNAFPVGMLHNECRIQLGLPIFQNMIENKMSETRSRKMF